MRVVAGELGGRRLHTPPGSETRPTPDRVREALFSTLHSRGLLDGATVLDAFGGSGALSIEALSRGASHATIIEQSAKAFGVIQRNVDELGLTSRVTLLRGDAQRLATSGRIEAAPFSLLFFDPPYRMVRDQFPLLLEKILAGEGVLADEATLVIEHSAKDSVSDIAQASLQVDKARVYGEVAITIATYRHDRGHQ